MAHDHAHIDPESGDRRVSLAIWANALLTVAQIVGGVFAGSLALIADALHNFSDMASLVIAFVARKIARRPADARMTFGLIPRSPSVSRFISSIWHSLKSAARSVC